MAQAANESAWGTSRFAQQGNNLFGIWLFGEGAGLVPEQRPEGATYRVRVFGSLSASVAGYMHNLNRGHAYGKLRRLRARMRRTHQPLDGEVLAQGLLRYSERGAAYVAEIQAMIRHNQLRAVDGSQLR